MQKTSKARLTEGSIIKTLIVLTLQMLVGILAMVAFNLIDTFFVGQLGTNELAAMSFTFPVVMVVNSLALGLGVGGAAVISRAIGEGNQNKVQRLTTDSLTLALLVVAVFVSIGLATIEFTFARMGATAEIMPLVKEYMSIWYLGAIFVVVPMVGNNAIRATGDTKTPSIIMLVAVGVNIILDPLLIFGIGPFPRLGLAGAALATVFGRATTFFVSLYILHWRENMITLALPKLSETITSWKNILFIGLPAAATNVIVPISMGIVTSMVAMYGPETVAGLGVATRIEMFALTMVGALGSVIMPFVGQNWGAQKYNRVTLSIRYSQQLGLGWGIVMAILLGVVAHPAASLFNDNPRVISTTVLYLWLVPISYSLLSVLTLSTAALNVLKKPMHAAGLSVLRMFVLYVPLAYVGSRLLGVRGIFGAASLANFLAGIAAYYTLKRTLEKEKRTTITLGSNPVREIKPLQSETSI